MRVALNEGDKFRAAVLREYRNTFLVEEWNIGVVQEPQEAFLYPGLRPPVQWFPPVPHGRSRADPFLMARDGRTFVFFEEFNWATRRGVISCAELQDGAPSMPRVILDLPVHASYPFILEYRGEVYCIPETFQAKQVSLYTAQAFPYEWVKVATLLPDVAALDSTVFAYGGTWWLACTIGYQHPNSRLHLWHAPDLFGPWEPHALNPVKTDHCSTRPAGTPFLHDGQLYRPAQDNSKTYGGRVVVNRVLKLSHTEFQEEPAAVIDPFRGSPYPAGLHTLSGFAGQTVVDGKRWVFNRRAFPYAAHDSFLRVWLPRIRRRIRRRRNAAQLGSTAAKKTGRLRASFLASAIS